MNGIHSPCRSDNICSYDDIYNNSFRQTFLSSSSVPLQPVQIIFQFKLFEIFTENRVGAGNELWMLKWDVNKNDIEQTIESRVRMMIVWEEKWLEKMLQIQGHFLICFSEGSSIIRSNLGFYSSTVSLSLLVRFAAKQRFRYKKRQAPRDSSILLRSWNFIASSRWSLSKGQ